MGKKGGQCTGPLVETLFTCGAQANWGFCGCTSSGMEPPVRLQGSITPINIMAQEELQSEEEEEEGVCFKRKRLPRGGSAAPDMEKRSKEPDARPIVVSPPKKLKDEQVTDQQEAIIRKDGGCREESAKGVATKGTAMHTLCQICSRNRWDEPLFELCQEQGPAHRKLFTYKVTVNVATITTTILECFSEPKPRKRAAQEHAAEGALWYLKHFGHLG